MLNRLLKLGADEDGFTLLEYAVLIALILVIMLVRWMSATGSRV